MTFPWVRWSMSWIRAASSSPSPPEGDSPSAAGTAGEGADPWKARTSGGSSAAVTSSPSAR